jgi:hypothetical protein
MASKKLARNSSPNSETAVMKDAREQLLDELIELFGDELVHTRTSQSHETEAIPAWANVPSWSATHVGHGSNSSVFGD